MNEPKDKWWKITEQDVGTSWINPNWAGWATKRIRELEQSTGESELLEAVKAENEKMRKGFKEIAELIDDEIILPIANSFLTPERR